MMHHKPNLIHLLLRERKVSLRHLARVVGVSPSTLSRWASEKQMPSPRSCIRLAESLSLPLEQVYAFAGHPIPDQGRDTPVSPDFREYACRRFPEGFRDDMLAMIEDLIPECYPFPFTGDIRPDLQV
ncbi:MAG: helix-turn-helix transcriptional regulator [Dehalococcoidia bacterium]